MVINPIKLNGPWTDGFALDYHTISSKLVSETIWISFINDKGETDYIEADGPEKHLETIRPPIGEALNQLKYHNDQSKIIVIATEAANYLKQYINSWKLHCIIPIPPSDIERPFQPVYKLAEAIGKICNLKVSYDILKKTRSTSQLKSINDPAQRKHLLEGVFDSPANCLEGKNILLFDDLFRSGETLMAATSVLKTKARCQNEYVLTITKTRVKQ